MNKFIPLTLASVIVIAMIFAVTPIEYAQTTHAGSTTVSADSVTTASIAPNTIVSADISNTADITGTQILDGTLATADILDDTIGPEDVTGSTDAAALIRIQRASTGANTLAVSTAEFTPIVPSIVLATCTASGTNGAGAITAGTMALTEDTAGTVQGLATRIIGDHIALANIDASQTWITTGVPAAATIFTCTMGGTGVVAADIDEMELITIWFPT